MKKPGSNRLTARIRHVFHAANRRLKKLYEEFADILDSDEDRLSLQFNANSVGREKKTSRRYAGEESSRK